MNLDASASLLDLELPIWAWWVVAISVVLASIDRYVPWIVRVLTTVRFTRVVALWIRGDWPAAVRIGNFEARSQITEDDQVSMPMKLEFVITPKTESVSIGRLWIELVGDKGRRYRILPSSLSPEPGSIASHRTVVSAEFTFPQDVGDEDWRLNSLVEYLQPDRAIAYGSVLVELNAEPKYFFKNKFAASSIGILPLGIHAADANVFQRFGVSAVVRSRIRWLRKIVTRDSV